jgi:hypothetical protein
MSKRKREADSSTSSAIPYGPKPSVAERPPENEAEVVARTLANFFYKEGSFTALRKHPGYRPPLIPTGDTGEVAAHIQAEPAFGGLAVQAVGYERGKVEDPAVHIYVLRASRALQKNLPKAINDVPLVVNRMGRVITLPGAIAGAYYFQHGGRVACGSSCAPSAERYSGTFGALVRANDYPDKLFCLSNNHVLAACNHVPVGQPIMSPSMQDSGPAAAPRHIANHTAIVELRSGVPELVPVNQVDIAIAEVADDDVVSSWQGDDTDGYDSPDAIVVPTSGMRVKKFGRSSGLTLGTVESITVSYEPVSYNSTNFKAVAWFENVWVVRGDGGPFSIPGDSGSLVVSEDGDDAVGVVFAGAGDYGWICPMDSVQNLFGGVSLVSDHNI